MTRAPDGSPAHARHPEPKEPARQIVDEMPGRGPWPFEPEMLNFNADGLLPAIAQDAETGEVLMLAWMDAEAVKRTLATGRVTYWSRSRQSYWVKGESSGNIQELVELRVDCDGDTLLCLVRQSGPACHTGRRSCFYRRIEGSQLVEIRARADDS